MLPERKMLECVERVLIAYFQAQVDDNFIILLYCRRNISACSLQHTDADTETDNKCPLGVLKTFPKATKRFFLYIAFLSFSREALSCNSTFDFHCRICFLLCFCSDSVLPSLLNQYFSIRYGVCTGTPFLLNFAPEILVMVDGDGLSWMK